jgi:hypothetical protein
MKKKLVTLIDSVGRYIIGELKSEDESSITLKTPVMLNVQPDPNTGKLHVQTYPLFFKEFLVKGSDNLWTYAKSSVVIGNLELDAQLVQQYNNIANPQELSKPTDSKVIKLFED